MPNNPLYDGIIAPQGGLYQPGPQVMLPPQGLGALPPSGGSDRVDTSSPLQYGMLQDQFGLSGAGAAPYNGGNVPGPNGYTVASKDQSRMGQGQSGNLFAYGDGIQQTDNMANEAIANILTHGGADVPMPRPRPDTGLTYEPALVDQSQSPGMGGDPWGRLRINGQAAMPSSPGMVTGPRPASMPAQGLAALPQAAPQSRPITYSATPVAAGNFAQGSPNQSFEKQNGMGSVTNSMAKSSRWNTGY